MSCLERRVCASKWLYTRQDGKRVISDLRHLGVKAVIIGTLPSNHDIDILIDKTTILSKTPIHWLETNLQAIKVIQKTDVGSLFIVSALHGHIDIFFSDPRTDGTPTVTKYCNLGGTCEHAKD